MTVLVGKRLFHVTTVDMSLVLCSVPSSEPSPRPAWRWSGCRLPGRSYPNWRPGASVTSPCVHATRSAAVGQDMMALAELWRLFRRLKPDIVHTHNPKPGLYGRVAARAAGVPGVVNTVHGLYASPEDRASRRAVVYALERAASLCSGAELVQNPEDLRRAGPSGRPQPTSWCCSATASTCSVSAPKRDGDGRRRARATSVSMPTPWWSGPSGVWCGRRASASSSGGRAPPRHASRGRLRGGGGIRSGQGRRHLARGAGCRAPPRRIVFAGEQGRHGGRLPGFDLFVLPSYREGFPRSAMEAAASGLPVIATDIRGCRQVVSHGETGLLVPLHDPVRLAAAIEELVVDSALRRRMGTAGRRKAEAEFDDRAVVSKTMEAYERVLPGHFLEEASDPLGRPPGRRSGRGRAPPPPRSGAPAAGSRPTGAPWLRQTPLDRRPATGAHRPRRPIPPRPAWWTPRGHGGRRTRGSSPGSHCRSGPARRPPRPGPARPPWKGPGPPRSPSRAGGALDAGAGRPTSRTSVSGTAARMRGAMAVANHSAPSMLGG
jgi:hypothetical protein